MKLSIVLPIVLIGFVAGYLVTGISFRTQPRSDAMVELFQRYCLPFARRQPLPSRGKLVRYSSPTGRQNWVDERTLVSVTLLERRCIVSDELDHLYDDERALVQRAAATLVQAEFPELEPVTNSGVDGAWDHFAAWAQYEIGDPRRWAIIVVRTTNAGELARTTLMVTLGKIPN